MYLNTLNEEIKNTFLDLSILAAKANNVVADDEIAIINEYCNEMQITPRYNEDNDFNTCVEKIKNSCSRQEIKIIALELTALVLSDNVCDEDEEKYMQEFITKLDISNEEYQKIKDILKNLSSIYASINDFINNWLFIIIYFFRIKA